MPSQQPRRSFCSRTDSPPTTDRVSGCRTVAHTRSSRSAALPAQHPERREKKQHASVPVPEEAAYSPEHRVHTTDLQLFLDWQWMDGRLCFKGQTGHWSSLGSLGVAGRCHAACQRTHGSKFQPHTAAGYQNAKPDRSSFRASLGSVWGTAGTQWIASCSPTKDAQIQGRRADIARVVVVA